MEKMNKETAVFAVSPFELERINNNTEYHDAIVKHIASQLCDRLIGILDTEKEVVVKRSDLITVEEPGLHQVQFRESINWCPLVRCKDCIFKYQVPIHGSGFSYYKCTQLNGEFVPGDFFCAYGTADKTEQEATNGTTN